MEVKTKYQKILYQNLNCLFKHGNDFFVFILFGFHFHLRAFCRLDSEKRWQSDGRTIHQCKF